MADYSLRIRPQRRLEASIWTAVTRLKCVWVHQNFQRMRPGSSAVSLEMAEYMDERIEQAIVRLHEDIIVLSQELIDVEVSQDNVWFRNLLLGILNSARRDYKSVEVGVTKSPYLAAWGARNLLELRVIAAYVVKSEENARELQTDLLRDQAEFWDAVIKSTVEIHPELVRLMREVAASAGFMEQVILDDADETESRGPAIKEPRAEAAEIKRIMNEERIRRCRAPQPIVEMARAVGLLNIYGPQSRMYSKLVHPTALTIASSTLADSLKELMPLILSEARTNLLVTFSIIKDHFSANGSAPVKN